MTITVKKKNPDIIITPLSFINPYFVPDITSLSSVNSHNLVTTGRAILHTVTLKLRKFKIPHSHSLQGTKERREKEKRGREIMKKMKSQRQQWES